MRCAFGSPDTSLWWDLRNILTVMRALGEKLQPANQFWLQERHERHRKLERDSYHRSTQIYTETMSDAQ